MTKRYQRDNQKVTKAQLRLLGARLVTRHKSFYVYMIFGFLAALINIVAFMVFHNWWKIPLIYANTIAFVISNLASFFFNKHGVFIDNVDETHSTLYQLGLFFVYRILSIIPDNLIMLVGLSWLHWNTLFVKIIDQIVVGIFNYLTTKSIFLNTSNKFAEKFKKHFGKKNS
ncbi:putative flippase GtrA [Lactobacillus colini]|uniref:Flippase GtrA n=1 Tax=Lactobacillus colini TaxID=1819254 RepID=A0ABS4MD28_9LACO|nr:GtrA family protein [Lactobacillus colini]MBP2057590.1 putative flippase GtrA [Lactobacillus colini]